VELAIAVVVAYHAIALIRKVCATRGDRARAAGLWTERRLLICPWRRSMPVICNFIVIDPSCVVSESFIKQDKWLGEKYNVSFR
jgi:hypothetical protein